MRACRLALGVGVRRARCIGLRTGRFSGALDIENNVHGSLLLLADNLYPATTDQTTKARRHKGRSKRFMDALQLGDPCGLSATAPGSREAALLRRSGPGCCSWPPPVGRAVRGCGDVVMAGWIDRQALVLRGRSFRDHGLTRRREAAKL